MNASFLLRAGAGSLAFLALACGGIAVLEDGGSGGDGSTSSDDCTTLLARFEERFARAISCKPKSASCDVEIKDSCGCTVFADDEDAAVKAALAYDKAFKKSCFAPCAGCTPSPGAACLANAKNDFVCTTQR